MKRQNKKVPHILWFSEIGKDDIPKVGGKGANLGELIKAGIPVPNGFCVTADAYYYFLEKTGLKKDFLSLLRGLDPENSKKLNQTSRDIKKKILAAKMPEDLSKAIADAYHKLGGLNVAVRSSATAEDLPDASFAGQQSTYLNMKTTGAVVKAVQKCYASLFEARAIYYRAINKYDHMKVGIAVPVQNMVNSDRSGILFTVDPVSQNPNHLVIEAGYGLGEAIVLGAVTPDRYIIDKKDFSMVNKEVNQQDWKIVEEFKGGDKHVSIPKSERKEQKITDSEILELAKLGVEIERHYGKPQDTEWAIENGEIYFVQSRPVTTLGKSDAARQQDDENAMADPGIFNDGKVEAGTAEIILKGAAASLGIASGPVKIIHKPSEIDKVLAGDVLVTEMTTPDFVPAMRKAVAIVTDTGGRTCFAGQTKILTNEGFVEIESISEYLKKGKTILTPSLNTETLKVEWKKVLAVMEREAETINTSISQSGRSKTGLLEVTPDHRFLTFDSRKIIKKRVDELINQDLGVLSITGLPSLKNKKADIESAYLLGVIGTDGSIYQSKTHGEVQFIQKECPEKTKFIEDVQKSFSTVFNYQLHSYHKNKSLGVIRGKAVSGTATAFRCYSKAIASNLAKMEQGLARTALENSSDYSRHFMAGALDGDGTYNQSANRLHFYGSEKHIFEPFLIGCFLNGISPQISKNRSILNIQLTEGVDRLLNLSKRLKGNFSRTRFGTRFLFAKQVLGDIIAEVNYKGRIKPYVEKNLLLDVEKIKKTVLPSAKGQTKEEIQRIIDSDLKMLRVRLAGKGSIKKVYNLTVEDNHNYVVFTDNYIPVVVANCHAAIVSRELGIPCVVGTGTATHKLKTGQMITVDGARGLVYKGKVGLPKAKPEEVHPSGPAIGGTALVEEIPITGTKVYVNLGEPHLAAEVAKLPVDGVGLMRAEFIIAEMGEHPRAMVEAGRSKEYVNKLATGIQTIAAAFSPRPVVYRATDFKTNEYRNLKGGEKYEPEENNPMIGYRGASRYVKEPDLFALELEAIKQVREAYDLKNLHLMIPFVRTLEEMRQVKKLVEASGLKQSPDFKLWMMVEIPSNVILLEKFIALGIDGVSIGSNDLTQLTLGADRDNQELAKVFDERDEAVVLSIEYIIKTCRKHNVTCSICGQAPSVYPEITEMMVKAGTTSVSVSPDMIVSTRKLIASVEKRLMLSRIIDR